MPITAVPLLPPLPPFDEHLPKNFVELISKSTQHVYVVCVLACVAYPRRIHSEEFRGVSGQTFHERFHAMCCARLDPPYLLL